MAYDYNKFKQAYEWLNDEQKKQFETQYGNNTNFQDFKKQYSAEQNNTPQQTSNESNFNNQNGTNWQNQTEWTPYWEQRQKFTDEVAQPQIDKARQTADKLANLWYGNQNNQVSPDLDQSKFNQDPWKITVQEWTAQQTGKPDYWISTDARLNEMKGNLDHYFATSPRMFSDRDTFNRVFDYNNRESDAQKQLLDSYWKRKEDMDKASTYTSWESINTWMKNWEITTDQLNLLKEYNPEAYRKWQQLQEDEIKKRIVNDIVPPTIEAISWKINWMIEALGIQAQDALDIEWIYNDTMTKVGAYQTLEDCNRTVKEIEAITNKKTAIMNRYAASTWGTVSDALAAARMQKAIAPYNEQLQGLQYQYQDYANLYSQKSATALQAANVRALQANENQRIWNQKCAALWFATSALSYRTPEENKQLDLQYQQAMNDMSLLQQSRQNDLALYNQYATAKMQNQLQNEMYDLSVKDPTQLRNNLNNVLSQYYDEYWMMIQRSQQQAVDDILQYAKDNNVSVAEALSQNFIKQLQEKPQYKASLNKATWYDPYANQQQRQYVMDEDWKVSLKISGYGEIPDSAFKSRSSRQDAYEDVYNYTGWSWTDYVQCLSDSIKDWSYWGQCGAFVNDVLKAWGADKIFWDSLKQKIEACNEENPQVWYAVVFDFQKSSSDGINHGHVGIVTNVHDDWSIDVLESNYDWKGTTRTKTYSKNTVDRAVKWYYRPETYSNQPTLQPRENVSSTQNGSVITNQRWSYDKRYADDFAKILTDAEWKTYTDKDKALLISQIGSEDEYFNQLYAFKMEQESKWSQNALNVLKTIQEFENLWWTDRSWGKLWAWGTSLVDEAEYNKFKQLQKQLQLQELFNAKARGATFWAMSQWEWDVLREASNSLNWSQNRWFNAELENIKQALWTAAFNNNNYTPENWQAWKDANPLASQAVRNSSSLATPATTSTLFKKNNGYNMDFISNN